MAHATGVTVEGGGRSGEREVLRRPLMTVRDTDIQAEEEVMATVPTKRAACCLLQAAVVAALLLPGVAPAQGDNLAMPIPRSGIAPAQGDNLAMPVPREGPSYTYGSVLTPDDQARLDALRRSQSEADAKQRAEMRAFREKMLRLPPLPDERNVLLGRWRVESSGRAQRKDELGQLMGMLANPGGAMCQMLFGAGITEFKPKTWASIDGSGDDSLGAIQYRGTGKDAVAAFPAKGIEQMYFSVTGPNRVEMYDGCALVRVGAPAAQTAANTTPGQKSSAASTSSTAAAAVVDGAAFRCADGSLLHVSFCQGDAAQATCKLSELHLPGLQMGKLVPRADIAARVKSCEAGGIRYGADNKPVFVR